MGFFTLNSGGRPNTPQSMSLHNNKSHASVLDNQSSPWDLLQFQAKRTSRSSRCSGGGGYSQ